MIRPPTGPSRTGIASRSAAPPAASQDVAHASASTYVHSGQRPANSPEISAIGVLGSSLPAVALPIRILSSGSGVTPRSWATAWPVGSPNARPRSRLRSGSDDGSLATMCGRSAERVHQRRVDLVGVLGLPRRSGRREYASESAPASRGRRRTASRAPSPTEWVGSRRGSRRRLCSRRRSVGGRSSR